MNDKKNGVKLVEGPNPFDNFAIGPVGYALAHNTVCITFSTPKWDHSTAEGKVRHEVAGRIFLPVAGAQLLAIGLFDFLKQRGLDPTERVKGSDSVQ